MKITELTCSICNIKFFRKKADAKSNVINFYCSRICQISSQRTGKEVECEQCGKKFYKTINQIKKTAHSFCSKQCFNTNQTKKYSVICAECSVEVLKVNSALKRSISGNYFCSSSCAAAYNNKHKTKGTRVSKLEVWIASQLSILYPQLMIHYNEKEAIGSELDIYFPTLKLAFELNGIFHYEPIYGPEKLSQIQNNDNRKFQACLEHDIELCIIDTSSQKYFKEKTSKKFLDIIQNIIGKKIKNAEGK